MNFSSVIPTPTIQVHRSIKLSNQGNMYKIPISHTDANGNTIRNYEVWTTKEAVQKHFEGLQGNPREYQLRKFARQMYEKRLRSSNGRLTEGGLLVTSNDVTHGNPKLWPNTLSHPEVKI